MADGFLASACLVRAHIDPVGALIVPIERPVYRLAELDVQVKGESYI